MVHIVAKSKQTYERLSAEAGQLATALAGANRERDALSKAFDTKAAALAELQARLEDSVGYGRELQGRLDEAGRGRDALQEQVAALQRDLEEQVGAGR